MCRTTACAWVNQGKSEAQKREGHSHLLDTYALRRSLNGAVKGAEADSFARN